MKVVFDPGHGMETPGKRSPDGTYREHEFALDMAYRCKAILESYNVGVVLTRWDAHDVSLAERVRRSNAAKPDLFVSQHSDAFGEGWTSAQGVTIYTSAPGGARNKAAQCVKDAFRAAGINVSRGIKHADFYVIKRTNAPALLIEHGFHTNRQECQLLKSADYRQKLAEAACSGILNYFGIKQKEGNSMSKQEANQPIEKALSHREIVKERFGLADKTLDFLEAYKFADALLEKLAKGT